MRNHHIDYQQFADLFDHSVYILEIEKPGQYCCRFLNQYARNANDSRTEFLNKTPEDILPPEELELFLEKCNQAASQKTPVFFTQRKSQMVEEVKLSFVSNEEENTDYIVVLSKDITVQKHQERKIKFLEYNDPFTELPNRALLQKKLEKSLEKQKKDSSLIALLYIDLDGFHEMNDYLGHAAGDRFLLEAIGRINGCFKGKNTLARVSSQGFVLMISELHSQEPALECAKSIISSLKEPFTERQAGFLLKSSIGITFSEGETSAETTDLLKQAELAMYMVKKNQHSKYAVYNSEMKFMVDREIDLENDMQTALDKNAFFLEYQPVLDMKTQNIISVEALIRWNHETLGVLAPNHFIPLAEKTNLILPLGEWVLRTACKQLKQWQQEGLPLFNISVNVSIYQLLTMENFVESVKSILEETGVLPHQLELEVTEKIFKENIESIYITLEQLSSLGVNISIDDFGAGHSSISILKYLPVDTIKIDRSFMNNVEEGTKNRAFLKSIATLADDLNIKTVMERVETKEQLDLAYEENSDLVQGFHLCPPVSSAHLSSFLLRTVPLDDKQDAES